MSQGYGWFEAAGSLTCTTTTAVNYSYQFWRYYYKLIKATNEILDAAGGDEVTPEGEENQIYLLLPIDLFGLLHPKDV